MSPDGTKRKLTAILSADVKGYSRLMENDEEATVATLTTYRQVIADVVKKHEGRVVDSPGDNVLAEFTSVVEAMRGAVEIQEELRARNSKLPDHRRMEFRIGINLGDVVEKDGRIYGEGVNIAARVEGISEAGGICISGTVYDQIQDKLGLDFEYQGEKQVKNIARPIRIYSVLRKPIFEPERPKQESESLTVKPSVAVLSFVNMSSDPEQDYFSDGISEDILNGLAKNPRIDVIARTSSFQFKGQNRDIRDIGNQLNATHILEGSVRKHNNRIRVTAQLINTDTGTHLCSKQYDRELTDVFVIQDEITDSILQELNVRLLSSAEDQMRTTNMKAYDAFLLGRNHIYSGLLDEAVGQYQTAVALDPNYAAAYGALVGTHNSYIWWNRYPARNRYPIIRRYIDKALSLNPDQPDALYVRTEMRFFGDHAYQDAISEMDELAQRYPNKVQILMHYGFFLQTMNRLDLALKVFDRMMELDPLNPTTHLVRGTFFLRVGNFADARQSFEKMGLLGLNEPGLFAELAFYEGDIQGIQNQLDLGQGNWGNLSDWYPFYKASALYLNGEHEKARELFIPLKENITKKYSISILKSFIAAVEGDMESSLDYIAQDLSESVYVKFRDIQTPCFYLQLFPDYRAHPKYQKMLRDFGLDEESIARLNIPPLPF